jgi:hypothetical protein
MFIEFLSNMASEKLAANLGHTSDLKRLRDEFEGQEAQIKSRDADVNKLMKITHGMVYKISEERDVLQTNVKAVLALLEIKERSLHATSCQLFMSQKHVEEMGVDLNKCKKTIFMRDEELKAKNSEFSLHGKTFKAISTVVANCNKTIFMRDEELKAKNSEFLLRGEPMGRKTFKAIATVVAMGGVDEGVEVNVLDKEKELQIREKELVAGENKLVERNKQRDAWIEKVNTRDVWIEQCVNSAKADVVSANVEIKRLEALCARIPDTKNAVIAKRDATIRNLKRILWVSEQETVEQSKVADLHAKLLKEANTCIAAKNVELEDVTETLRCKISQLDHIAKKRKAGKA